MKKRDMQKFKKLLEHQRDELMGNAQKTLSGDIHLDPDDFPDEIDAASSEMNLASVSYTHLTLPTICSV